MLRAAERSRIRGANFRLKRKLLKELEQDTISSENSHKRICPEFKTCVSSPQFTLPSTTASTQNRDISSSKNEADENFVLTGSSEDNDHGELNHSNAKENSCEDIMHEFLINQSDVSVSNPPNEGTDDGKETPVTLADDEKLIADVKILVKRYGFPHSHTDGILKTFKPYHPCLPLSHKTLLGINDKKYDIEKFSVDCSGYVSEFVYFGLAENLKRIVNPRLHSDKILKLQINFDGLPLFKSSRREFWPILCKIYVEGNPYNPFVVAVHSGHGKPKDIHQYLWKFVREINFLLAKGIEVENEHWSIEIMAFVCDTPARAYIKCTQGHAGFHACEHCTIIGFKVDGTTIFPVSNVELRSDASFRLQTDPDHHRGVSPLLLIRPKIEMIRLFVLDFMHLVCLGIVKRLVTEYWIKTSLKFLDRVKILRLSARLSNLNSSIPVDFQRSTRDIHDISQWKANEYRFFLLYSAPLVLKDLLSENAYKHFLLLSIGCRILCGKDYFKKYSSVAKESLDKFVKSAQHPDLYGLKILIINMHNLVHLAEQVKFLGVPLMDISAFAFENLLGKIKRFIGSGNKPLSQLCNKIDDYLGCEQVAQRANFEILAKKKKDKNGKISFKRIKFQGSELNMNKANNVVLLNDGTIVRIMSMHSYSEPEKMEEICIQAKRINIVGPALDYPIDSTLLKMYSVSESENNPTINTTLNCVQGKMILLNVLEVSSDPRVSYAMPLLHMN